MSELAPQAAWLVDASVALKWFLPVDREPGAVTARSAIGRLAMRTTALAVYEVGNILVRSSGWSTEQLVAGLGLLLEICGEPIELLAEDHPVTVRLALDHGLTFYDASYVAIAQRVGRPLISADADLLAPGLAMSVAVAMG